MMECITEIWKQLELCTVINFDVVVSFILGLFASFFVDEVRRKISNRRKKKFILRYLNDTILTTSLDLEEMYRKLAEIIKNQPPTSERILAFEMFNAKVLNSIEGADYYDIFKKDYANLNEIISIVEFLSSNLPDDIEKSYYSDINQHLKDKNLVGDFEHLVDCEYCKQQTANALKVLEFRVEECQNLQRKIHSLLGLEE
ncbi:hypothetical protein ACFLR1_05910 [Bacteroidota bacterium]